jgi:hypothetical protein
MHNEVRIRTSLAVRYKYPLIVPTADHQDRFARLKKLQVLIRDHRPWISDFLEKKKKKKKLDPFHLNIA